METRNDENERDSCFFRVGAQNSPIFKGKTTTSSIEKQLKVPAIMDNYETAVSNLTSKLCRGTYRPSMADFAEFVVRRNKQRQKMLHGPTSYLQLLSEEIHSPFVKADIEPSARP
jgi:hypothetical protein